MVWLGIFGFPVAIIAMVKHASYFKDYAKDFGSVAQILAFFLILAVFWPITLGFLFYGE